MQHVCACMPARILQLHERLLLCKLMLWQHASKARVACSVDAHNLQDASSHIVMPNKELQSTPSTKQGDCRLGD